MDNKKKFTETIQSLWNILSSDTGNIYRYRLIYGFCIVVHSFYAILFGVTGVTELMIFNIISSAMYVTGFLIAKFNRMTLLLVMLVYVEIIAHCFMCSYVIGFEYQFVLFSVAILPVTYFITYLDPAIKKPMILSSVLAVINFVVMVISLDYSSIHEPLYTFPVGFVNAIARLNIMFSVAILISFALMFLGKIKYDMNKLKEQNDALDFLANYDQLTGLRNRNHIRDIFISYIKSTEPYCVILGDIDDFKQINDTYGHSAGDEVLRSVASIIKENVSDKGEVCRWGGEEILILLKGSTRSCIDLNEKILTEIRKTTVKSDSYSINVTMTFGLCDYGDETNIEKLISLADKRMYIGKKNGKNQVVTAS